MSFFFSFDRLAGQQHSSSAASIQKIKYIFGERPDDAVDAASVTATAAAAAAAESEPAAAATAAAAAAAAASKAEAEAATAEAGEEVKEGWLNCKVMAVDGKVRKRSRDRHFSPCTDNLLSLVFGLPYVYTTIEGGRGQKYYMSGFFCGTSHFPCHSFSMKKTAEMRRFSPS